MATDLNSLNLKGGAIVRPVPGQSADMCGIGACGAFASLLVNALDSSRFSTGAIAAGLAAAGNDLTFTTGQSVVLFSNAQTQTPAATAAEGLWWALSKADTNQTISEFPVPLDYTFCVVGMAASVDPAFQRDGNGTAATNPKIYSQWIDAIYNSALQTAVLNNVTASIQFGGNGATYDLGTLRSYPFYGGAAGGNQIRNGVIAAPLMFTPFNSVVCVANHNDAAFLRLTLAVGQAFTVESIGANPTALPTAAGAVNSVFVPVTAWLYGFVIGKPGTSAFASSCSVLQ